MTFTTCSKTNTHPAEHSTCIVTDSTTSWINYVNHNRTISDHIKCQRTIFEIADLERKYNYIYGISASNVRIKSQKWSMATICNSAGIQLYQISSELTWQADRLRNMRAASCHHYDVIWSHDVIAHVTTIRLIIVDFLKAHVLSSNQTRRLSQLHVVFMTPSMTSWSLFQL